MKLLPLTTLSAALALSMNGNAATISINAGVGDVTSTTLAGAVRVNNWNVEGTASGSFVDSSGDTVAGFTYSDNFNSTGSGGTNDQAVFNTFTDVFDTFTRTISVSGLTYATYDVYAYMRADGTDRAGSYTLGGTTYYVRGLTAANTGNPATDGTGYVLSTDTTIGAGTDIQQGNYVKFSGLTDTSFALSFTAVNGGSGVQRNKFAGLQIVAVPEPSSTALIGLGGLALILRRRR